jgi:hypothetical protein
MANNLIDKYPIDNYTKIQLDRLKNIISERAAKDPLLTILNDIIQRQTIVNKQNEHRRLMEALHSKRIQALRINNFDVNKIKILQTFFKKYSKLYFVMESKEK